MAPPADATTGDALAIQAHRGFAGVLPENTVLAVRTAAERFDADWVEVDVQPTADGTVVCFHDAALHATEDSRGLTDASGTVWKTPSDTVRDAEVLDSGETVPTLAAVLAALPADVGLNVELKNPGSRAVVPDRRLAADELDEQRALWEDFVTSVAGKLADCDRPVVLSSFCEGALAAAADRAPALPRAVITTDDLAAARTIADRHDAVAINVHAERLLDAGESFVTDVHAGGRAVNAWTVREWTTARDLHEVGVDGLIADYPFLDVAL